MPAKRFAVGRTFGTPADAEFERASIWPARSIETNRSADCSPCLPFDLRREMLFGRRRMSSEDICCPLRSVALTVISFEA